MSEESRNPNPGMRSLLLVMSKLNACKGHLRPSSNAVVLRAVVLREHAASIDYTGMLRTDYSKRQDLSRSYLIILINLIVIIIIS